MIEPVAYLDGKVVVYGGDCMNVLVQLPDNSIDSVVVDPPYHLTSIVKRFGAEGSAEAKVGATGAYRRASSGFMGKVWDGGDIAFQPATWAAVLRVLKPGGHMVAFGGDRTFHRLACAIEDAGFEVRGTLAWLFGSGFPKNHDISKALDRAAGAKREVVGRNPNARDSGGDRANGWDRSWQDDPLAGAKTITAPATDAARQWQGWGTALKPAMELICLARKPLSESSIAANVLKWGTGALNIDGCRVAGETPSADMRAKGKAPSSCKPGEYGDGHAIQNRITPERWLEERPGEQLGRWPANLIHDGSDEVLAGFPETEPSVQGSLGGAGGQHGKYSAINARGRDNGFGDSGSAARYFYTAKADSEDRLGSKHPTVKPLDLMQYLCRLVTPPNGTVLDMFAGTGTTGEAAWREGFKAILIEREAEYLADIARRMELAVNPTKRAAVARTKNKLQGAEGTPLFSQEAAE